ncbi:hypothetical protein ACFL0Y_04400, partial [Patescibacteria group bacterium]
MVPLGSLSIIFHFLIILFFRKRKVFFSLLVALVIFGLFGTETIVLPDNLFRKVFRGNFPLLQFQTCEAFEPLAGEKQVVLRIDDVQAYAWQEVTQKMVEEATMRKIPLVLGIIPANF